MTDIVERLRFRADENYEMLGNIHEPLLEAADEITLLRAEVLELNSMFDARWSADMRAIECWRKENPGNELVLPDHVNLCLWLMEERTRLTAEVEQTRMREACAADLAREWESHCKTAEAENEKLRAAITQAIRQHEEGNRGLSHRTLCEAVYGEQA